jgi:hypothetical protein
MLIGLTGRVKKGREVDPRWWYDWATLMSSLDQVNQAVCKILSTQRIGQPVFVRCAIGESPRKNDPAVLLARLAELARNWLGQELAEAFANSHVEDGPLSLALKFHQGATALLICIGRGSAVDLMILGNHGAVYFDDRSEHWGEDSASTTIEAAGLTAEQNQFLDAIRSSLRAGKPLSVFAGPP